MRQRSQSESPPTCCLHQLTVLVLNACLHFCYACMLINGHSITVLSALNILHVFISNASSTHLPTGQSNKAAKGEGREAIDTPGHAPPCRCQTQTCPRRPCCHACPLADLHSITRLFRKDADPWTSQIRLSVQLAHQETNGLMLTVHCPLGGCGQNGCHATVQMHLQANMFLKCFLGWSSVGASKTQTGRH